MLVRGELDADTALSDPQQPGRSQPDRFVADARVRPLFERQPEGWRYFATTGLYPINHTVVVRRTLLEKHPWIALNLYSAFLAARAEVLRAAG